MDGAAGQSGERRKRYNRSAYPSENSRFLHWRYSCTIQDMTDTCKIITVGLNQAIDRVIEVPDFSPGAHLNGRQLFRTAGGKAFNVSIVCSELNTDSTATGFLGDDTRAIFDSAMAGGLITDRHVRVPGATRENITIIDPITSSDTHIKDIGPEVTPQHIQRLTETLTELASPESIIVFSGSLPQGITPADHNLMIRSCTDAGSRVAVDTSGPALE
ncbi:MAG TPA: hypothetical protein ENL03_00250, partial [Phycisphaerae bacterium]|nr:hypothetical protein [Phycisphaerae bacterium]